MDIKLTEHNFELKKSEVDYLYTKLSSLNYISSQQIEIVEVTLIKMQKGICAEARVFYSNRVSLSLKEVSSDITTAVSTLINSLKMKTELNRTKHFKTN